MRRCLYLAMLVALAALAFAPAAMAQQMGSDNMMGDDNMKSSTSSSAMSSASAKSSASAMSSTPSSASATSRDQMMGNGKTMSPSASASASSLPGTGGPPLLPLISAAALVLILGSRLLAATVVRRNA